MYIKCLYLHCTVGAESSDLLHQHTPRSGETESLSEAALLDGFVRLNRRVHVVTNRSAAAALYSFKQAADALDATDVQVLTCSRRQAVLQVYEELLFTPVYSFHYCTVFNDLHCPLDDLALTCSQRADVKDEISTLLQRLPAVKAIPCSYLQNQTLFV